MVWRGSCKLNHKLVIIHYGDEIRLKKKKVTRRDITRCKILNITSKVLCCVDLYSHYSIDLFQKQVVLQADRVTVVNVGT